MSNALLTLCVLAGFFLFAGGGLMLAVRGTARSRAKVEALFLSLGFVPSQDTELKAAITERLTMVNPRSLHSKRQLLLLYKRPSSGGEDYDLYLCYYLLTSSGAAGISSGGHMSGSTGSATYLTLVYLVSKTVQLPRFLVESTPETAGLLGKIFKLGDNVDLPGLVKIEPESVGFDPAFRVYIDPQKADVFKMIQAPVVSALHDKAGIYLYADGDTMIFDSVQMGAQVRKTLDPQKLKSLIHLASALHQDLSGR